MGKLTGTKLLGAVAGAVIGLLVAPAAAHVPVFSDGLAKGPQTAIQVNDVTISRVVYHEVTDGREQLWITFQGQAGLEVPFRLGVPMIDRLSAYRPALAVLGPGLPPVDLPFAIPEGLGGVVMEAQPDAELEVFHEHFTGTQSWIVGDLDLTLPADGRYYAVAYVPSEQTGKLWVAMGDREVFGADDILGLPATINRVRAFHEVPQSPVPCFVPLFGAIALAAFIVRFHRERLHGADPCGAASGCVDPARPE
jgi:hypothetical protein